MESNKNEFSMLKVKRGQLKSQVTRLTNYFHALDRENLTELEISQLVCRLERINPVFSKFEEIQSDIELLCGQDGVEDEEQERFMFEECYYAIVSEIKNTIGNFNDSQVKSNNNNDNNSVAVCSPFQPQFQLPDIKIPTFTGSYDKWLEFRDSFLELVHNETKISNIQKFYYLKSFLGGDALELISSIKVSSDNYSVAWSTLNDRYENKKIIIYNYVKTLVDFPAINKESHEELRKLFDNFTKSLRSLESLGEPIHSWSTLIVYLITSKYDYQTRRVWESSQTGTELPSWNDVSKFLKNRCEVLEKLEITRSKEKHNADKFNTRNKGFKGNYLKEKSNSFASTINSISCYFCKQNHSIYKCIAFNKLNIQARLHQVSQLKLCENCFDPRHNAQQCEKSSCRNCGLKHNSMICEKNTESVSGTATSNSSQSQVSEDTAAISSQRSSNAISSTSGRSNDKQKEKNSRSVLAGHTTQSHVKKNLTQCLLSTALIYVLDAQGNKYYARALLDPGSQGNFVTERFASLLGLKTQKINYSITGVGDSNTLISRCKINITIKSIYSEFQSTISCMMIPKITQKIPAITFDSSKFNIPSDVQLADEKFNVSGDIDILVGVGLFYNLLLMEQIKLDAGPLLQKTKLGWILGGEYPIQISGNVVSCLAIDNTIDDNIERFWQLEECGEHKRHFTKSEKYCEDHFVNNFSRNEQGRFVVKIPLKENVILLGDSRQVALDRFYNLEKRLIKNEALKNEYSTFMTEYIQLGHMSRICDLDKEQGDKPSFYMPHHAVIKQSSLTTKCRVVFDASAKSSSGLSLNDVQYSGPTIQGDLLSLLLRFRCHRFILGADIAKMYRQVLIDPDQRCFQKIFWRDDSSKPVQIFELNTITYGCSSSPFLACRTLHQLAYDNEKQYPRASRIILEDFYMDDLLTGADDTNELLQLQKQVSHILSGAGFELRKWVSNNSELISQVQLNTSSSSSFLQLGPHEGNKTLGVYWNANLDTMQYSIREFGYQTSITKRVILSITGQIFDPLGLLGPIIINAKLILQVLWQEKLSWDDQVSTTLRVKWLQFCENLQMLNSIQIPRYVLSASRMLVELHAFADASEKAYGACVYLVCKNESNQYFSQLLCAKSRVAPLKKISIPRLELCAALLLAILVKNIKMSLKLNIARCFYWSDSTITLCWLKGCPSKWKTFVANRVSKIQELTNADQWYHVSSQDNPADYLSRGTDPQTLSHCDLWWYGPTWLSNSRDSCSLEKFKPFSDSTDDLPEQKTCLHVVINYNFDFTRFSSFSRLKHTMAYCLRFIYNLKRKHDRISGSLSTDELHNASIQLLKLSQRQCFNREYQDLKNNKILHTQSRLLCLNPFIDDLGLIRVGGRLKLSKENYQKKHPIVLSNEHQLTKLIMKYEHERLFHCGPQQLLYSIREIYWPICGRKLAKSITRKCVVCFKAKPTPCQYIMGNLPDFRTHESFPFVNTGLDYAGPVYVKDRKVRNAKLLKCYICLFICMTTKCIHLELVTDLTTDAFLNTLKRFMSRRGKPSNIYSDNATTFRGANNELLKFLKLQSNTITDNLNELGISWHFIPPRAPNFGGLWESNIKQVKYHLKRMLGGSNLTFESFYTVLTQIEAILNSRPLCPMSSDPNDLIPLTPAHFLIGRSLTSIPEPCVMDIAVNRLNNYQHLQQLVQQFWRRWHLEYISELQSRAKWKKNASELLKVGRLVVVKEDNQPVFNWKLGRLQELFYGKDNVCRVALVKCSDGTTIKRAVSRLCVLPIYDNFIC